MLAHLKKCPKPSGQRSRPPKINNSMQQLSRGLCFDVWRLSCTHTKSCYWRSSSEIDCCPDFECSSKFCQSANPSDFCAVSWMPSHMAMAWFIYSHLSHLIFTFWVFVWFRKSADQGLIVEWEKKLCTENFSHFSSGRWPRYVAAQRSKTVANKFKWGSKTLVSFNELQFSAGISWEPQGFPLSLHSLPFCSAKL